jgi:hypothetical protein
VARAILLVLVVFVAALLSAGQYVLALFVAVPVFVVAARDIDARDGARRRHRDQAVGALRSQGPELTAEQRAAALAQASARFGGGDPEIRDLRREWQTLEGGVAARRPIQAPWWRLYDPDPRPRFHPSRHFIVRVLVLYPAAVSSIALIVSLVSPPSSPESQAKLGLLPPLVVALLTMMDSERCEAGLAARLGWTLLSSFVAILAISLVGHVERHGLPAL